MAEVFSSSTPTARREGRSSPVYLCFRGPDVLDSIVGHLYGALLRKGIRADVDVDSKRQGDASSPLVKAIQDSRVAVVFFSKNYAASMSCLSELAEIMERRRLGELVVLPVFYGVDYGDVREQRGRFREMLRFYEINLGMDTEKVNRWREALSEASQLSGWHLDDRSDMARLVKGIVKEVAFRLHHSPSDVIVESRSHDVFLSFRGPDSRHTIISHLYRALRQKGVQTFMDSAELEVGQRRSELFEAIEGSRIAIIMLSRNYASSKWCLDELNRIMERVELDKLIVLPIFYRVSPREVRLHEKESGEKGSYQVAMEEMEARYGNDSEMVKSWREALWKAGDSIGFCLPKGEDEGNVVEQVTKEVMKILIRVPLEVAQYPVGISSRLQEVEHLLQVDAPVDAVHTLGILGPGGAGKTTLSKAICNRVACNFDNWCFLSKVRETALVDLQQTLLRELLCVNDLVVSSVDKGKIMIQQRLCNKRVLVILDDVDEFDQINALVGNVDWFGKGSRIIITTRNRRLLNSYHDQNIYEVRLFDEVEAEDLFQYHATNGRKEHLDIDRALIDQLLHYANGLPLALQVLGRSLCGRSVPEWKSMLDKLDRDPPDTVLSVLKVSFDGLDNHQQEIFLDIACFFKGWDKDYVVKVLDSCGFQTTIDVNILDERCLVTIEDGKFQMHDLLEAMGKSIARGRSSGDDGIRNRIWRYDEFTDILPENLVQERHAIKGIVMNSAAEGQNPIGEGTFKDFKSLRLLIVRTFLAPEESLYLPSELRWLEWPKCPAHAIHFSSSRKLVAVDLQSSEIRQILGEDFKELKYLNLRNCRSLGALPDLSRSSNLEDLNLYGCKDLSRLEGSIGSLDKLVHLNLEKCCNLAEVPSLLQSKDFRTINFSGCCKLNKFPAIKEELHFLVELSMERTSVTELPESICNLVEVKILNMRSCTELTVIPSSIYKLRSLEKLLACRCSKLEKFPREESGNAADDVLPNLVLLDLQYCNLKDVEFLMDLTCFETLKELNFSGNCFARIPSCTSRFKNLEAFWLCSCEHLVEVPELPNRVKLYITGCRALRNLLGYRAVIDHSPGRLYMDLSNCHSLDSQNIDGPLSLEMIREFGGSADVIVPWTEFPRWMDFQIVKCHSDYKVTLPEGMSEDNILGLALSVTFSVTATATTQGKQTFPAVRFVVGNGNHLQRSALDQWERVHTWFAYIPRQPLLSEEDADFSAQMDWNNITFCFEGDQIWLESCGLRVICKEKEDDRRFVVRKIGEESDDEYDYDHDDKSDHEESSHHSAGADS